MSADAKDELKDKKEDKKTISHEDYMKLVGLVTVGRELSNKLDDIINAGSSILSFGGGDDDPYDHSEDMMQGMIWSHQAISKSIKVQLKRQDIIVLEEKSVDSN